MHKLCQSALLAVIGPALMASFAYADTPTVQEITSTMNEQKAVAVTIYNNDLALIKDTRSVTLKPGFNLLALRDVSAQIQPETALLRSVTKPGSLQLLEQNFDFDLLTPNKMLEKYIGKTVSIIKTNPANGAETTEKATVLSANNGVVLKIGNRIETGIPGRIAYDDVPANLRERPTLITQLNNQGVSNQTVELSYLSGGLSWKADYVAELSAEENQLDLSGWVTLTNTSGASYRNAKLQLVAGDVNRVTPVQPMMKSMRGDVMMAEAASPMAEESLLEYHLYTLDHPTTIAENQTKQVALLSASAVPVHKTLVLRGADYYYQNQYNELGNLKAAVYLEFDNKEVSKLGMPLPKGILRVYKKDRTGNIQFVGEDQIDHTPKNETVRLKLGNAFDVTANRKQTSFKVLPRPSKGNSAYESAYELTINNAKKEKTTVLVQEPINGDWTILTENKPHTQLNSHLAQWQIEVPAEGHATLTYRVQVKY